MKNEVFNGSRFWTYFKYDLTQMWRYHMRAALGIGLSGLIVYVVTVAFGLIINHTWAAPSFIARVATFFTAFAILELYQTRTYGYLTDKQKGSAWLMIPASTLEKWLSMMVMTLIVIPLVFLVSFFAVDSLLCLIDPTCGGAILGKTSELISALQAKLGEANAFYETAWSIRMFIGICIASYCANFLFFLLCGVCFKRYKILAAFAIIFVLSLLFSIFFGFFGMGYMEQNFTDFADAEAFLRDYLRWTTISSWIMAIGLGGGIYYRIKTLKH